MSSCKPLGVLSQAQKGKGKVKYIKAIIPLFMVMILISCNTVALTPATNQTDIMGTTMSIDETEVVMIQTAIPTITPIPPTLIPLDAYADKIEYATAKASEIIALFPYANETALYKEYSGCVETNDFQSLATYTIPFPEAPMETINTAFVKYFQSERWEFTEAAYDLIGDYNDPTITYDVYRIWSKDRPALERLRVILHDRSFPMGRNYIDVRAELRHIETKESLGYISDFDQFGSDLGRICQNSWW